MILFFFIQINKNLSTQTIMDEIVNINPTAVTSKLLPKTVMWGHHKLLFVCSFELLFSKFIYFKQYLMYVK